MPRTARALLIATANDENATAPKRFKIGADAMAELLAARGFTTLEVTKFEKMTLPDFKDAAATLRAATAAGDLAIILFGGHGDNSTHVEEFRQEGWVFADKGIFRDSDLGSLVKQFLGAEIVVISDCCYAQGMFTSDDTFLRRRVDRLMRSIAGDSDVDFVLIASALEDQSFGLSLAENPFIDSLRELVPPAPTYTSLGDALFIASADEAARWVIDAAPPSTFELLPLATSIVQTTPEPGPEPTPEPTPEPPGPDPTPTPEPTPSPGSGLPPPTPAPLPVPAVCRWWRGLRNFVRGPRR